MDPKLRSRGWIVVIQQSAQDDHGEMTAFRNLQADYKVWAPEVGETTGNKHFQCYIWWKNTKTFSVLQKKLQHSHIEFPHGTPEENTKYITGPYEKDGKVKPVNADAVVEGDCPSSGKRTDLNELKRKLVACETTVEDILMDNPMTYHMYGRTLEKIEDVVNRKKFRWTMTKGIWFFGDTDVGKSHQCFEELGFDPDTWYVKCLGEEFWDGYVPKLTTVVFNEFRGEIKLGMLLALTDRWPMSVKRKGKTPCPFVAQRIIITSPMHPREVYKDATGSDNYAQLERRLEIYYIGGDRVPVRQ